MRDEVFMHTDGKLDVLYLHVPKFSNYYKPFDEYMFINFISMGLFALADITEKAGFKSKILHLGIEWICDNNFSIIEFIRKNRPKVVAVPIFWHPQTYDAVKVIEAVKKEFPEIFIITGGFTASYFADQVVRDVCGLDALIHGHGEASIAGLVRRVIEAREKKGAENFDTAAIDLSGIPNLLWKKRIGSGKKLKLEIVKNPETFFASTTDLDNLNFTNISLLSNYETYRNSFRLNVAYSKKITREDNLKITPVRAYHIPLFIGRGCPTECKVCAGRNKTQIKMNHSGRVIWRSPEKVCDSLVEIKNYGFDQVIVCFDPTPKNPEYFVKLFRMIRERNIEIDMFFESWGLPDREFVDEFSKTFKGRNSAIAISAESGSEAVRDKIRGYSFSNAELMESLDYMEKSRVGFLVFFTVGNPFETEEDLSQTSNLIRTIKNNYNYVRWLTTYPVQIEPGSAIFEEPEKFGVEKILFTFMDYYRFHGKRNSCLYTNLGYNVKNYFRGGSKGTTVKQRVNYFSKKITQIRCKNFCILHPDPAVARHYCKRLNDKYTEAGGGRYSLFKRNSFV